MTVGDTALDRTVGCPWCRHRFRPDAVLAQGAEPVSPKGEVPLATPPTMPRAAEPAKKPGKAGETPGPAGRAAAPSGPGQPPSREEARLSKPGSGAPEQPGVGKTAGRGQGRGVPTDKVDQMPERAAFAASGRPSPGGSPPASETSLTIPRRKVARLILTETAEPKWTLAPDGSLPSLHLEERTDEERGKEKRRSGNPLLLILVLCGSLVTSLILLFVDTSPTTQGSPEEKARARQILAAEYYAHLNPNAPLAEYQRLLREAHWAHSRGDYKREKELYRRVLLLLYAERGRNTYTGLTGSRTRDQQLEELLRILLKD